MTEQQLFANYELDNSRWQAIIYKFLGASLAVHLVFLLSAVYVPVVRDAFYVAMLFSNTDLKTTSKDYTLDEIGDVTMINLADPNRFRYPEGYFNTGEYVENPMDPTILAVNGGMGDAMPPAPILDPSAIATPTPFPTPAPTPPIPGISIVNNPPVARNRKRRTELPPLPPTKPGAKVETLTPKDEQTAKANVNQNTNAQPSPSPENKNGQSELAKDEVNRKPLYDFAAEVTELQKSGKIDLSKPYSVTVEGDLGREGELANANVTKKDGDPQLTELAKKLISVLNASRVLKYISDVSFKDSPRQTHKIKFDVVQDANNLNVNVVLEFDNAEIANRIQSGANSGIGLTKMLRKDKIEGQILQNVETLTDGKLVIFKSAMPRQDAQKLIQDQLATAVKEKQDAAKQ